MSSYIDSFVELKFYPPNDSDSYIDQVPAQVRATIFNSSNLKDKGYTEREGFKKLVQAYCSESNSPTLQPFWRILQLELTKHYKQEEAEILVSLKFFPPQATKEYIEILPQEIIDFLASSVEVPQTETKEDQALEVIALMQHSPAATSVFCSILKQRLINYYVVKGLEAENEELRLGTAQVR